MSTIKVMLILLAAWIGTFWPGGWTSLLLMSSLSVLCLTVAYERTRAKRGERRPRSPLRA